MITIRAVFNGSVLLPDEPLLLEPNKHYVLTVEEEAGQTPQNHAKSKEHLGRSDRRREAQIAEKCNFNLEKFRATLAA